LEETEMMTRKALISSAGRSVVLATIAALALTTSELPLLAAPASHAAAGISTGVSKGVTDFSARRHRYYRRGGSAAGLAFMGLAIGTIAGAIAAEQRRDYYYNHGYYYGPGPYYDPGYYGGPYYYGRPYYGRRHYYRYY
jgi:MFS family permease